MNWSLFFGLLAEGTLCLIGGFILGWFWRDGFTHHPGDDPDAHL